MVRFRGSAVHAKVRQHGFYIRLIKAGVTGVRCNGKWLLIGINVNPAKGVLLSIDRLSGEEAVLILKTRQTLC